MNQILLPLENSKMTLLKKLKWPYFTDNSPKILKQPKDIPKICIGCVMLSGFTACA